MKASNTELVRHKEILDETKTFLWQTMKGEVLTLDEMTSDHKFNCLKMLFNHVASEYDLPTIWFTRRYRDYTVRAQMIPKELALQMCVFIISIEQRGDLSKKYWTPYQEILTVLQNLKVAKLESKLLNAHQEF